jgi:G3E family GTPase
MSQSTTIAVHILTGFLGSGKTTLLNHALQAGFGPETAVVVNEFGDVGLDQLFVQTRSEETIVLKSGCICCTIRADLTSTLLQLLSARDPSAPPFRRILIETSGISDPLPILQTLRSEFNLLTRFRVGSVVCTVDALDAASTLFRPEGLSQVTAADAIVITKCDIAEDTQVAAARDAAAGLNPLAEVIEAKGDALVDWLARCEAQDYAPERALRLVALPATAAKGHGVSSIVLRAPSAPSWPRFAVWLTRLVFLHGDRILRMKGVLFDPDRGTWIGIHGVRRFFHPPVHLALTDPPDCGACLVFITEGLDPSLIERSYQNLLGGATAADTIGQSAPLRAATFGSESSAKPREQMVARAI